MCPLPSVLRLSAEERMTTPTRVSPPESIHLITRRTTQGQFLLRPDSPLVQNFYYLLGYMQSCYEIGLHAACFPSNHIHLLMTDHLGDQLQRFNRHFFSLMARSTNCYRERTENLWNTKKPNCVLVAPTARDIIDRCVYVTTNAVEAGLVSHAKKWPGVQILAKDIGRLQMVIQRPNFFYNPKGKMPEEVTVRWTLPTVWDAAPEELQRRIAEACNARERELRERARIEGRKFMGPKRVLRQAVNSSPKNPQEKSEMIPHVACKDKELRKQALAWRKERQGRYDELRKLLLDGAKDLIFPEGTFVLHFQYGQVREPWTGCIWRRLVSEP